MKAGIAINNLDGLGFLLAPSFFAASVRSV